MLAWYRSSRVASFRIVMTNLDLLPSALYENRQMYKIEPNAIYSQSGVKDVFFVVYVYFFLLLLRI